MRGRPSSTAGLRVLVCALCVVVRGFQPINYRPPWTLAPPRTAAATVGMSMAGAAATATAAAAAAEDPVLIDGKRIAAEIRAEVAAGVVELRTAAGVQPGLAVVLVGSRQDSATYVRMKKKACEKAGIADFGCTFDDTVTQEELLARVRELNDDPRVHGILVQLPLPSSIDEATILKAVDVRKDVDGLHPINMAAVATTDTHSNRTNGVFTFEGVDFTVACTPQGCIEMLDRCGIDVAGKRAVVVGRSNMVGVPVAMLLMQRDATVTIVHSRSEDPAALVREADIVVAAAGKAELVRADWIKQGAVVIDVGINTVDDPTAKKGYRMVGDVAFDEVKAKASRITPVPGGVGPMTIAMLLRNTLRAAVRSQSHASSGAGAEAPGTELGS